METSCVEPAGPWHAFDGRRPPHTRQDQGPTRGESHHLSRADAQHGVYASLHEEGEVSRGAQAPVSQQYLPRPKARVDRWPLGQVVGQEGRDHQLQEQARAGM